MRIRQYKILHLIFVFTIALAMQGCVLKLGFAAVSQLFAHEHPCHQGQSNGHDNARPPSHCHDSEGREADFCCDNSSTLLSKAPAPFEHDLSVHGAFPSQGNVEKSIRQIFTQIQLQTTFLISSISGPRDKYALSCLLHAPPLA